MKLEKLQKIDKKHLWHPISQMKDYEEYPSIIIDKAEGVWLYKKEGGRILDAISSWWTNIFGHCNEHVSKAIKNELNKIDHIIFANYSHSPAIKLAENLVGLFDGKLSKVFYTDNGASSVEVAMKMSYQYWYNLGRKNKKCFAYIKGAYHGETLGALSVCSIDTFKKIFDPLLPETYEVEGPNCYRCSYGKERETCNAECFEKCEIFLNENHEILSAFIIEPLIQCANGMNMYSPVYLKKLRKLCTKLDIHLIADEIATGFVKTGKMMACDHADIVPDFITLSKALTSGFLPMAAVLTKQEIYDAFYGDYTELKAFIHSHTHSGNPLACAAANAVFELLCEKGLIDKVNKIGKKIRENVIDLLDHKNVGEIRTQGIITAIELVKDKKTKEPFDWKKRTGYNIYRYAEKNGVLLRNLGDVLYFMPPFVIKDSEIDFMTKTAKKAITHILKENL